MNYTLDTAKVQLELQHGKTAKEIRKLQDALRTNNASWTEQSRLCSLREQGIRIQRARERVGKGEYGQCLSCHRPIDLERLNAVPDAEFCINCHRCNVHNNLRNHQPSTSYYR